MVHIVPSAHVRRALDDSISLPDVEWVRLERMRQEDAIEAEEDAEENLVGGEEEPEHACVCDDVQRAAVVSGKASILHPSCTHIVHLPFSRSLSLTLCRIHSHTHTHTHTHTTTFTHT